MLQDFPDQREMPKQPANAPVGHNPSQQPEGAVGVTANKPENVSCQPSAPHVHPAPQPPPCNESKTFGPTESKPGEPETNKVYGTFKNTAPAVPGSVAESSAFRKDSTGSAAAQTGGATASQGRGMSVQYGDPLRATTEQNNASGNWTAMSQTTIVLGTDGNTSVQPSAISEVRELKLIVSIRGK